VDWRVLSFAVFCALATTLLFGLFPALTVSKPNLNMRLKEGEHLAISRRRFSIRPMLAVCQLALSFVLLIAAGLLIRSFLLLMGVNAGFDANDVLLADVSLAPLDMYTPDRQVQFFDRVLDSAQKLPGVQYAAVSSSTPLVPFNEIGSGLRGEGEPQSDAPVCFISISNDYFKALRIQLLEGRFFDLRDRDSAPHVAILNRTLARELFHDRDPVGRRVKIGDAPSDWVIVVGVVADIRHRALDDKVWPELFRPYAQVPSPWMSVVLRSISDPSNLARSVVNTVQSIDRTQPLFNVESMAQRVSDSTAQRRFRAWLFGGFAFLALTVAVVGLYGVMAYAVACRIHEIGVRLAVGAQPSHILRMVGGQGLRLALAGIGFGLVAAYALTDTLRSFLYGVTPTDAVTFAVVSVILALTFLLASAIPANRAAKVDPMTALRHE
jgi:putative ABC transport system permease protein